MNNCEGNCNTCSTECTHRCPVCKGNTEKVSNETVKSMLVDKSLVLTGDTYICLNRKCEVVYFDDKLAYLKEDVKYPIWFKENISDMIVCYCRNITLQDIIETVKQHKIFTKEEIIEKLGKNDLKVDCLHNNPMGKDCDQLFINAIIYAKGEK